MRMQLRSVVVLLGAFFGSVSAQTWCGKNYMASSPVVPPSGQFPTPATSSKPLLAFRCAPAIKPYLPEDISSPAGILIDAFLTNSEIVGAEPIDIPLLGELADLLVTVNVDGHELISGGVVPLNATKVELPFSLAGLKPQKEAFNVSCSATFAPIGAKAQTFKTTTSLAFLPDPPAGRSVTKMDLRTGALLAKPATGKGGSYEPVLPVGFYTAFGDYLATNISLVDQIKAEGYNVIHPIPTFDNLTALTEVIQRMEEVGIYLMYDMRWTYMNLTGVAEEVERVRDSPALLLWYTGDEPDGTSDPLNATSLAYDEIYELDGYHPVSLVLNCQDYYWTEYTAGSDIVMEDVYPISNNVTWSVEWNTPCTLDYGDCGCDNCKGSLMDISDRLDEFQYRLWVSGWDRTKAVWGVPQGFGGAEYWPDVPTGKQWVAQSVLSINHGALGVVSWEAPSTDDITTSASLLASAAPALAEYIASPSAKFQHVLSGEVDVGFWTVGGKTLVLATNLVNESATFDLDSVRGLSAIGAKGILDSGASIQGHKIVLEPTGSGAFILG
ncbi:hypothetical protein CERSUDRAFT_124938 [Gelatoporia subvermispora B]|uniref:Glycoside hydrolase family 2 protein n=1 Tax=Ceriporiopsis subvermispora (strain B) TaxID=914234 RepID=M2R912_CERS8|nr:hypothetical protein CERSUDRAFT_124938 [Gelatoporia subvermispora B]